MTNQEMLKRAIDKAIKNGADQSEFLLGIFELGHLGDEMRIRAFLLSHPFAKAFWGEDVVIIPDDEGKLKITIPAWQYHLKHMVLEENPLNYIEKFL